MLVGQHLFGIPRLDVSACHEGAQQAAAHVGLHLGHSSRVKPAGRMKIHSGRCWRVGLGFAVYLLKHPINHAHMKVHMRVQAGAEVMANPGCLDWYVQLARTRQ